MKDKIEEKLEKMICREKDEDKKRVLLAKLHQHLYTKKAILGEVEENLKNADE